MKILEKKYPMGSLKGQKTPGRYINKTLNENIRILAKNITKDMTYMGIITSSTLEVGTGKSVFTQQIAEAYLEHVREIHGIDNTLSMNNVVFRPEEIIERAFKVPRYSIIICDEWEDSHYWSELGKTLRQFFRKCRQLNLFILIIIPNFFQLPISYAVSRSIFLIDVKFTGEFDRGYFSFYNFNKKKNLYLKGKKMHDYDLVKENFTGRFADGYVVDEELYRKIKLEDLEHQEHLEKKPKINERDINAKIFHRLYNNLPNMTVKCLTDAWGISPRTGDRWLAKVRSQIQAPVDVTSSASSSQLLVLPTGSEEKETKGSEGPIVNGAVLP